MVNNACHALTEKARKDKDFEPKIHVRSRHLGHGVEITIRDNGPGINDQILDKIFNPFFTTRPANREHIGLGLSISYDIVRAHQGDIKVSSKLGVFTEFKILLPKS